MDDHQENKLSDDQEGQPSQSRWTAKLRQLPVPQNRPLPAFMFAAVFAVVGVAVLILSYAATPPAAGPSHPKAVGTVILRSAPADASQPLCLDDYQDRVANGTPVVSSPCDAIDPAQQWTLYSNGTIRTHDTECLDTAAPFNKPGAQLITYTCNDAKSHTQAWSPSATKLLSETSTELTNGDAPHLCLSSPPGGTANTQLQVAKCSGTNRQQWIVQSYQNITATKPGVAALQSLYNNTVNSPSRGLFCTGLANGQCWWDSANELNGIINYTEQTGDQAYVQDIATTYQYAGNALHNPLGAFLDKYNDDDAWWGLTWLNAYKLTGNKNYLQTAENIFSYIQNTGWTAQCGGGVFQFNGGLNANNQPPTKDAVANGLYVTLAARLYQATGNAGYLNSGSGAIAAANWFLNSGLIVSSGAQTGLIEDHVKNPVSGSTTCKPAVTQKNTYNQGMILNGLANLYEITGNKRYLQATQLTAKAVLADKKNSKEPLIDASGVLTEACQGAPYNCNQNGQPFLQWKGPFMRSLYCLNAVAPTAAYKNFFATNARQILKTYDVGRTQSPVNGVNAQGLDYFGFTWDKYSTKGLNAATQGSAVDALNANLGGSTTMCSG